MKDIIRKFLRTFFAPVAANPLFFLTIIIFGTVCVITEAVAIGNFRKWFLIYDLMQGCVWAYLLTWVVYRWDRKWLKGGLVGLWGLVASVEALHYALLEHTIDVQSVSLALDTNPGEIHGFFSHFFTPGVIIAAIVSLLLVGMISIGVAASRWKITRLILPMSLLTLVMLVGGAVRLARIFPMIAIDTMDDFTLWYAQENGNPEMANIYQMLYADPIVKGLYIYKGISLEKAEFGRWEEMQHNISAVEDDILAPSPNDSLQLVVIIGESFIKSHSSLYGYHLATNPMLEKERADSALVVYTDMITAGNFTNMSISNLMNLNRLNSEDPSHRDWRSGVYFPLVFKKAGWKVSLFTNQYDPSSRTSELGRMFFAPFIVDSCYDAYNTFQCDYDGDFLAAMVKAYHPEKTEDGNSLTIWHLKGQHFPAFERYPQIPEHERFTLDDIPDDKPWLDDDRRQQVADYANATVYNDSIVTSIINLYRDKNAVVVYFSDHGEEMWDTAPWGNRNKQSPEDAAWMHRQFDIPFVVWMSDAFRHRNPAMTDSLRAAASRPGSLDGLGQMMLQISGIKSKYTRPEESIISAGYRPLKRISAQGYIYPD